MTTHEKRIEDAWLLFRKQVIPHLHDSKDPKMIEAYRLAFYAGAGSLWKIIFAMLSHESEPTDADLAKMSEIEAEFDEFLGQLYEIRLPRKTDH